MTKKQRAESLMNQLIDLIIASGVDRLTVAAILERMTNDILKGVKDAKA